MSKKPAPFLLRLYQESEEDRVILAGLEKYTAIKGDKTRLIKKILFEYFSGHSHPLPFPGADAGKGLVKKRELRKRDADEGRLSEFLEAEDGAKEKQEGTEHTACREYPDETESLKENLSALSELLL